MVLCNSVRVWIMRFAGSLCLTSFALSPLAANQIFLTTACDPATWMVNQAKLMENEIEMTELVDLIMTLRSYAVSQGCEIPLLMPFLDDCRVALSNQGFLIDDTTFDVLKREIKAFEKGNRIDTVKHKHHKPKKEKKELKVNSRTAVGFLKFVAGSLLCLVPVPLVQGAGIGLCVIGVSEMADGAREQADERENSHSDENQRINRDLKIDN